MGTEEAIKRWDAFADTYAKRHSEEGNLHKEVFLNPALLSLMGDVQQKNILDTGCGD